MVSFDIVIDLNLSKNNYLEFYTLECLPVCHFVVVIVSFMPILVPAFFLLRTNLTLTNVSVETFSDG